MRSSNFVSNPRLARSFTLALASAAFLLTASPAGAKIEADKTRTYKLSSKHGPWMIMVTSLGGETPDQEDNAQEAANELVYQLRRKGIPAYIYRQDDQLKEMPGVDRQGRNTVRKYVSRHGMIGVVAGNYPSIEDKTAQQTLKAIKRFEPKIKLPNRKGRAPQEVTLALNKAFLTPNPLLSPEEFSAGHRDPLLATLNSGHAYSLLENKGKYSLIVASFYGNSMVKPAEFARFDINQKSHKNISLENAASESEKLCAVMRKKGHDAWVYHERHRSVVTVGSFQSKDDPEIARLKTLYGAKYKQDKNTGAEHLVAEAIKLDDANQSGKATLAWTMDPVPTLLERVGTNWQVVQEKW